MRNIIILCLLLSAFAYAQDKYNNFSPSAIEPENFFEYPSNDSRRPEPYIATIRRTPYDAGAALEGQMPDNDIFKRRSYTGQAEFLRLQAPEVAKPPHELTAIEKKAMLEELISARYSEYKPRYDVMELLPEYYCSTADSRLMSTFLDMLWANRQTVSMKDWLALSECFICRPENMLNSMGSYSKESKRLYRSQIIHGIELLLASATRQQELKKALDRL